MTPVTSLPVRYHGAGTLHDISLAQVGALMNDDWIAGTADGKFELEGSGDSFRELLGALRRQVAVRDAERQSATY